MLTPHLPIPSTSFVGRDEELSSIAALLADPGCRLLTLLGAGGIGKTRLALQAAAGQGPNFTHGVYFVPLAPVGSAELLPTAIAGALQLIFFSREALHTKIIHYLLEKQMLLVMDGFEHLLAGSDLLTDILQAVPSVKFLVTSRERLNVQEEWVLALEGLHVPDGESAMPLESYSAVQLFVQRTRQMQPNFSLSHDAEAVKTICQYVEGMPLGLELAACWLRAMSCQQIAAHIAGNLDFLTSPLRNVPERHRSLRAVFEQSWKMLSDDERNVLMRLSVFRGGFALEAAEQVAGATPPLLASLTDKSLIRLDKAERYDLHELLRQYAAEKLEEAGETRTTANDHLAFFLALAEQAEAHLWGREQRVWYDRLEIDLDNLRTATTWSVQAGEAAQGLRIAGALGWFFNERSQWSAGLAWLKQLLVTAPHAPASVRAKALHRAGELDGLLGDRQEARALAEEALALARIANDRWNIAWSLACLGYFVESGDHSERASLLDESLALFREIADPMGLNHVLRRRAHIAVLQGDFSLARALNEEALLGAEEVSDANGTAHALMHLGDIYSVADHNYQKAVSAYERSLVKFREAGNTAGVAFALGFWAYTEYLMGNTARAQDLFQEQLAHLREVSFDSSIIANSMLGLAIVAEARGEPERAVRLLAASERTVKENPPILFKQASYDAEVAALRSQLDDAVFAGAWETGKTMTREQSIAFALEGRAAPADTTPAVKVDASGLAQTRQSSSPPLVERLSERELEVLRLVAAGLSNREIAEQLVLALGTIKWYLNQINGKLGTISRTQAVARARELGFLA